MQNDSLIRQICNNLSIQHTDTRYLARTANKPEERRRLDRHVWREVEFNSQTQGTITHMMNTWAMYRDIHVHKCIHKYSDLLVVLISVGLALARKQDDRAS